MTKLDEFQPTGEHIHPYDVCGLVISGKAIKDGEANPSAEDADDYLRNQEKIGRGIWIDGQQYWETTRVEVVTEYGKTLK